MGLFWCIILIIVIVVIGLIVLVDRILHLVLINLRGLLSILLQPLYDADDCAGGA